MGIKANHAGHRQRLRERFLHAGISAFSNHEILELLLTFVLPRKDVKPVAKLLLTRFHSVRNVIDAPLEDLKTIPGVGEISAIGIKFIKNFAELYLQQPLLTSPWTLDNNEQLERFWRMRLGGLKFEVAEVAFLDTQLRLLQDGVIRISEGVVDRTCIQPRKIMEYALKKNAHAIIVAHNHPSGSVLPSDADCYITQSIKKAAETLDLRFIDHLIIGATEIYSFRRSGCFPFPNTDNDTGNNSKDMN